MPAVPTNVLLQFTMVGQLLTNSGPNAFQLIYWDVYNTPDFAGAQSGYEGQLQNISVASTANLSSPTSGTVVPTSAAGGDLAGNYPNPTVAAINGSTVPAGGALTPGFVLQATSSAALVYAPVNLAGGAGHVQGQLPAGNQAGQTMGGDVTGTTAAAVVASVNGVAVTGTPSAGQAIVATSPTAAHWAAVAAPTPTGTGFVHITGGSEDSAARAVSLASADVTGVTPVANGGTGLNAAGANGTVLQVVGGNPAWGANPGPARATPGDANTLIRWTLDEAAIINYVNHGAGAALTIGINFNNTVSSAVSDECGILGSSVLCTGHNGVSTGDTALNEPSGNLTVSLWFRPRTLVSGSIIFQKAYASGGTWSAPFTSLWFSMATASGSFCPWGVGMAIAGSLHQTTPSPAGYMIQVGVWNFLCVTWDGITALCYINGVLSTHDGFGSGTTPVDWGTHGPWDVGGVSNSGGLGSFTDGWIDDVRVENTVRSASYIAAMYQTATYGSVS